ncbi:hypothetical protein GE09DRAFT_1245226 [Coniochaeta sp. 2T2.1]|nr:hypothetical protein GE09DRAFT_1245226 [Coniochaeta sp. 2T2.1]
MHSQRGIQTGAGPTQQDDRESIFADSRRQGRDSVSQQTKVWNLYACWEKVAEKLNGKAWQVLVLTTRPFVISKLTDQADRSPSTSPPPEPISEDFMIEGLDNDDRYRMVEDEFLSMANDFTKHLHAAEYQRLKAIANTRNAEMIRTISRPVTGRMTDLVKRRRGAAELAASQRRGLKSALGKRKDRQCDSDSDESDGELPWAGTSLQGLMESPRKVHVPLPVGSSSLGYSERASTATARQTPAGPSGVSDFASRVGIRPSKAHVETTTDEDEDDLDAQPRYVARTNTLKRSESSTLALNQKVASIEAMSRRREPTLPLPRSEPAQSTYPLKVAEKRAPAPSRDTANVPEDDDDDDDDFQARLRKRRAEQKKRREEEDKKRKQNGAVDAIPLF